MSTELLLTDHIATYIMERDMQEGSIEQLRIAVRLFSRFLERPARIADLTDESANKFMVWLSDGRSPHTVAGYRRSILCLWRSAFMNGLTDLEPRRIRKIRRPVKIPVAWTKEEVQLLLRLATMLPGKHPAGITWKLWWPAYIRTAWDSALRRGDLLRMRWDDISPDGLVMMTQGKTGWPIMFRLNAATIEAIRATNPETREVIFDWPYGERYFSMFFSRLVECTGVRKGSSKWLRRASATAAEIQVPGSAKQHLGHQTHGLAYKHYVDPRQVGFSKPAAPSLDAEPNDGRAGAVTGAA